MKLPLIAFTTLILLFGSATAQITVNGATLPATLTKEKQQLVLNGGGVRIKYFLKVYVAGLYLPAKNQSDKSIVNADQPMAVRLQITSTLLTSKRMEQAIREGFEKSLGGNTAALQTKIDAICKLFSQQTIKIGDIYDIWYVPGEGVKASLNGKQFYIDLTGLFFKQALFGIWLSPDPVDEDLKIALLGLK